jgi:hypothetical protein
MGQLEHTRASLRIFGENLNPDEITALLGVSPTKSYRKGEPRSSREGSPARPEGSWHLSCDPAWPGNLDAQINELLSNTTDDPLVWRTINEQYRADLFTGLFMDSSNDGLTLMPETLAAVGQRGLAIAFDIYSRVPDDQG